MNEQRIANCISMEGNKKLSRLSGRNFVTGCSSSSASISGGMVNPQRVWTMMPIR